MGETEAKMLMEQLKEYQKDVLSSKEKAREALYRAGLITKAGRPAKPYRRNLRVW